MTHTYNISGMTCGNCVAKAKSQLLLLADVLAADVQLDSPQAAITMQKHIATPVLQNALSKAGVFTIKEADGGMHVAATSAEPASWLVIYKPILLIGGYILGATLLLQAVNGGF